MVLAHDMVDPFFNDLSGGSDANGREPMGEQTALIVKRPKRKEKGMAHSLLLEYAADALRPLAWFHSLRVLLIPSSTNLEPSLWQVNIGQHQCSNPCSKVCTCGTLHTQ